MSCYNIGMRGGKEAELLTLERMIGLYCSGVHGCAPPCGECRALLAYGTDRLRACPQAPKPACRDCRVHCYSPAMRERVRAVMRYAGPRMTLRHPWLALRHLLGF